MENASRRIAEQLRASAPEAVGRFALAAAKPLADVALHEGFEEVLRPSTKARIPSGGMAELFARIASGGADADRRDVIRSCELLERAAGKLRVSIRAARLYETAAHVLAHAVGFPMHGKLDHVSRAVVEPTVAAIAFYVLDRIHGTIPEGQVRSLSSHQIHEAYAHRWTTGEIDRHLELARLASLEPVDGLVAIPSRFAAEVRAGVAV